MEEEILTKEPLAETGQLHEILLVLDKEEKKISAVTGIDKDGQLKKADVAKKNQGEFMRVDMHGDLLTNFFSNFFRQLKDPTRFSFFKVPLKSAIGMAKKMQDHINSPTKEGEGLMEKHHVKETQKHQQNKENTMETTEATPQTNAAAPTEKAVSQEYRFKPEQIDWETISNLGLSKEKLEEKNLLEPLLKGYKTNIVVPVNINLGSCILSGEGRLSLQEKGGKIVMAIHGIRKEPNLNTQFFGHQFTDEDKSNLRMAGNMGRIVNLTNPKTGETIPSIISVDRLTNELVAYRSDWIKIPNEIKGVILNEEQKKILQEGKPLFIEGMTSSKGEKFDANVQFNADKRYVEFLFDRNKSNHLSQGPNGEIQEVSKVFRGKELDDKQFQKLQEGKTVYVTGLIDKKGEEYKGYITYNKENGKTMFSFKDPNALKDKVKPAQAHATQVAVNSDGKSNEATSKIQEPLQPGQQTPKNAKQQEDQKHETPTQSRGRKR
ncbi:DUF3945 domain-containing protein [Chryseobacterium sp. CKR4-1]|uniref:DUF3945 domain-containing protein n=1 Tax=Chryseobacterium sp. CKR4-1 TaxID=3068896 RepID=UPI002796C1A6|nr:DUF3945 domain-containing protein [Chryseobacterium sp. CKR4-1]MDQ1803058.1 DUF3945 domain-containing protein [Chryseobacterium sp. CKR4-1]